MTVLNMMPVYLSSSVQELVENHCKISDIDKHYSLFSYLATSNNLFKQAAQYKTEGDLEKSYIYSIRFCSLLLEKLPKHPDYNKDANKRSINELKLKANKIILELESIKSILESSYVKKREEEEKQKELDRLYKEKIRKVEEEKKRKLEEEKKRKEEEERLKEIEDELNQTIISEVEKKKKNFFLSQEITDLLRQEALELEQQQQKQKQQQQQQQEGNNIIEERADILSPIPSSNVNQVTPIFNSDDLDFLENSDSIYESPQPIVINVDDIENIEKLKIKDNDNNNNSVQFQSNEFILDPSVVPPPEKEKPPPKLPPIPTSTNIPEDFGYPTLNYSEYQSPPLAQSPSVQTQSQQQIITPVQTPIQQQTQQSSSIQQQIQTNSTPPSISSVQQQLYQQQQIYQQQQLHQQQQKQQLQQQQLQQQQLQQQQLQQQLHQQRAIQSPQSFQSPPMQLPSYTQQFKNIPNYQNNSNNRPQYQIPNISSSNSNNNIYNANNNPYITQASNISNNNNKINSNNSTSLVPLTASTLPSKGTLAAAATSTSTTTTSNSTKKPNIDSDEASKKYSKLRNIVVDFKMFEDFMKLAEYNTSRKIETCGILSGTLSNDVFTITTIIIPKQEGTTDTCNTIEEHEIFEYQLENDLLTLGWVHTHPTQECFLSAVDLHTHCSYQYLLQEAIAVVIAPRSNPNFGIFRLTDPPGLETIQKCKLKSFHPHPPVNGVPVYTSCNHVKVSNGKINGKVVDLRKK